MSNVLIPPTDAEPRLISRASIVILAAFLAGLAVADVLPPRAQVHAACGAAAGAVAFFALRRVARMRDEAKAMRQELRTVRRLEHRLDRNVPVRRSLVTGVSRRLGRGV